MHPNLLTLFLLTSATALLSPVRGETAIRLNTVGYRPELPKHASVVGTAADFEVVDATNGRVVLTGQLSAPVVDADTKEPISDADFSAISKPGEYRVRVGSVESPAFRIGPDVFDTPYALVTRGMYLWRCGVAVDAEWQGSHFHHEACHTDDAWLDFVTGKHEKLASTGGWHDAGDYNKYVVNAGVTVGCMLRAWEDFPAIRHIALKLPETGGALPDFLAEVKFETDWLLTMQADDGSVYTKVSTQRFGAFVLPEKETTLRYVCPWGTPATADFVAMLSAASRAFRPYSPDYAERCLAAARKSYAFLVAHPDFHTPDQSAFHTGGYITADGDDRLWAAAECWESTGDAAALHDVETRIRELGPVFDENFDWGDVRNLGLLTYLFSKREGRDEALTSSLRTNLLKVADAIVTKAKASGYARPLGSLYYWGGNGGVARQTLVLQAAYRVAHNPVYRTTALDAVNYLLGRNVHGRSYVTGLGAKPPLAPHDRRSGGDDVESPWPGYLVGGPHPGARDWQDVQADASKNEIAINWNAALIYALAGFVDDRAPAAP